MTIWTVIAIKQNYIEDSNCFFKHEEAIEYAWNLVKDDLFFEEIDENDEPYIPAENPFLTESRVENDEGSAAIEILSFLI